MSMLYSNGDGCCQLQIKKRAAVSIPMTLVTIKAKAEMASAGRQAS